MFGEEGVTKDHTINIQYILAVKTARLEDFELIAELNAYKCIKPIIFYKM